jgi:hypothetical protein
MPESSSNVLHFNVTENMTLSGIFEFILRKSDFIFTLTDNKKCAIPSSLHKASISDSIAAINKNLNRLLSKKIKHDLLDSALLDIENELVSRIDEITEYLSKFEKRTQGSNQDNETDRVKSKYLDDVSNLRKQFKESGITYEGWQQKISGKYIKLQKITNEYFSQTWLLLEFCLSVKSILNLEGITLPFMGVLLAAPASMKTMIIQLFRKYPTSFYSDSFTPNSLISHNSSLTEEQLQQIDMLPKMKDKVFLTPELAPIFTSKEDELQRVLGMITRILDGHGFENDSGAHGHRRYGNTMFVWIGAAVEIPHKVWKILGTLGHKIYFFRPEIPEKSINELANIAKSNNFEIKFNEIETALLEYLKVFDAAPDNERITRDKNGIVKVKWNESDAAGEQQDKAIEYIAEVSRLLAHLRGTVYVSEVRSTRRRYNDCTNGQYQQQQSNVQQSQLQVLSSDLSYQLDGPDYDTDLPIIEDPSRAVILLRNLAIAHAISQGRDTIGFEDIPMAIKVALSTAMYNRIRIFDLLLKNNGELITSDITKGLRVSEPTARRTMREFHALKIVDISAVTQYSNAELKITLRSEYSWFKTEEFKSLSNGLVYYDSTVTANVQDDNPDDRNSRDSGSKDPRDTNSGACDSLHCHSLKVNPPPDADEKNNSRQHNDKQQQQGKVKFNLEPDKVQSNKDNASDIRPTNRNDEGTLQERHTQYVELSTSNTETTHQEYSTQHDIIKMDPSDITEKNNACVWGSNDFQRVTPSHCHTPVESASRPATPTDLGDIVFEEVLSIIKAANGSQLVVNTCIASGHSNNELVRTYLGDNLTSRDNRKVRDLCLKIIRHHNIEVVKHKPQLVVKWVEANSRESKPTSENRNSTVGGDSS